MATHDYVIDNSTGANVRADINSVLQAILTNNSNSSAPSTTAAYMWWADTTSGTLKIRNATDNAWVELLQLDGTLTLEDGSASAPALANRGDLDTGVFFGAANQFNVATGGVERLKIDSTAVVFNETGADVDFRIEGDANAHLFQVDAGNGRVGIGLSSPDSLLHVFVSDTGVTPHGSAQITLERAGTNYLQFLTTNTGTSGILFGDGDDNDVAKIVYDHNLPAMQFITETTERMRINDSGFVGIGTTSPSTRLHCDAGTSTGTTAAFFENDDNSAYSSAAEGNLNTVLTLKSTTTTGQNDQSVGIQFTLALSGQTGSIQEIAAVRTGNGSGKLVFRTRNSSHGRTERVMFGDDGTVIFRGSVANTSNTEFEFLPSSSSPYLRLNHTANNANHTFIQFRAAGIQVGEIKDDGDGTITYATSSDYRLKENIVDLSDAITRIKNLKPRRFNFKVAPTYTKDGFLAHELQEVVPEAVQGTKDEVVSETSKANFPSLSDKEVGDPVYQTADVSRVVPLLAAGLKEAIAKIEVLETKVAALEAA